jgi:hypothetical protein
MNAEQAFTITEALTGYWPTPAMEAEEVKAWLMELTGDRNITPNEAAMVIRLEAENGAEWRMRPGQIVSLVQHHRRQEALRWPRPSLPPGKYCTPAENVAHLRELRKSMAPAGHPGGSAEAVA